MWVLSLVLLLFNICSHVHGDKDVGTFWYYTDINVDMNNIIKDSSSYWGSYENDTSTLVAFTGIEKGNDEGYAENQPDFVILGGSSVSVERTSTRGLIEGLAFIAYHMKQAFNVKDVPVLPILGLDDSMMPIDAESRSESRTDWCTYLAEDERIWKEWVDGALQSIARQKELPMATFGEGCYHSLVIDGNPKLLLLGLNSMVWYSENPKSDQNIPDPLNQFQWIEKSLMWARNEKAKVMIVTHIPLGKNEVDYESSNIFWKSYNDRLVQLIRNYSDVISTVLSGFKHIDSFQVVLNETYHPINTIFSNPSVTPKHILGVGSFNPRIRQFKYSRKTGQILDYRQFRLNLSRPHPAWEIEYTPLKDYRLKDLSAQSLADLLDLFTITDNPDEMWAGFWDRQLGGQLHDSSNGPENDCSKANSQCRCRFVCSMRHLDTAESDKCLRICASSKTPVLPTIYNLTHPPEPQPKPDDNDHDNSRLIAGVVVGVLCALIICGVVVCCVYRKRRHSRKNTSNLN